jgi:hypothetical protein
MLNVVFLKFKKRVRSKENFNAEDFYGTFRVFDL